jgi:TonB family protein
VYSASEVDQHARRILDGIEPAYPDSLRPLGIDGKVLAQFVVDTTGLVDTTSILTEAYGQPLFAASVRQALATMHFTVAQKGGHKVEEEIEQSFVFHKEDPPAPPARIIPPGERLIDSLVKRGGYNRVGGHAEFLVGSAVMKYPPAMERTGLSAIVNTQFVIDSTGVVDMKTFRVISVKTFRSGAEEYTSRAAGPGVDDVAPEQSFVQAVRAAMPQMRFIPARVDGHNVRQLVTNPFTFTMMP